MGFRIFSYWRIRNWGSVESMRDVFQQVRVWEQLLSWLSIGTKIVASYGVGFKVFDCRDDGEPIFESKWIDHRL